MLTSCAGGPDFGNFGPRLGCVEEQVPGPSHLLGVCIPGGWTELLVSTTHHWKIKLRKVGLGNPSAPRYRDNGLIRGRGRGICGKQDH